MASSAREENVYMAKLAEQAERIEELVQFMEKVSVTDTQELTVEERNLLSVAYKNVIGARRASWRIISSIEQNEESIGNEDHLSVIKDNRSKIEKELSDICDKLSNMTIKGDYHRYLAEFKTGAGRKESAESTLTAYKSAQEAVPEEEIDIGEEMFWHDHNKCIEAQQEMPKPVLWDWVLQGHGSTSSRFPVHNPEKVLGNLPLAKKLGPFCIAYFDYMQVRYRIDFDTFSCHPEPFELPMSKSSDW